MGNNEISEEVMTILNKVIRIQIGHYKIVGYDKEDLYQEAFIICLQGLQSWDMERPLENFLAVHLSNRLKSLVRDKYKLQGRYAESTKRLLQPVDIDTVNWDAEHSLTQDDFVLEGIILSETERLINDSLPISLRKDYLQMRAGIKIHRGRVKKIRDFLKKIIRGGVRWRMFSPNLKEAALFPLKR